jgi:hypothetical protein
LKLPNSYFLLLASNVHSEGLGRDKLVEIFVVSTGQLVAKILIGIPDFTRTNPIFNDKPIEVGFAVIDHGNPVNFFERFLAFPE